MTEKVRATHLVVCRKKKQFFDPSVLTDCYTFKNFSLFDVVGRAILLLTNHSDTPKDLDPECWISPLIGAWTDCGIVTTSEHHKEKDLTGNMKLGNLYSVACNRFEDVSERVKDMVLRYDRFVKGELDLPPHDHVDSGVGDGGQGDCGNAEPASIPADGGETQDEADEAEDYGESDGVDSRVIETIDDIRFVVKYRGAERWTVIQEKKPQQDGTLAWVDVYGDR